MTETDKRKLEMLQKREWEDLLSSEPYRKMKRRELRERTWDDLKVA